MAKRSKNNTSKIQVTAKDKGGYWQFSTKPTGDFPVGELDSAIDIIERDLAHLADELVKYGFDIDTMRFSIREQPQSRNRKIEY